VNTAPVETGLVELGELLHAARSEAAGLRTLVDERRDRGGQLVSLDLLRILTALGSAEVALTRARRNAGLEP
jgi:hypothetical protein